jgi:transcriptional regulator with GAF, ATPase, and Fis domain
MSDDREQPVVESREARVADAFVQLVDSIVDRFDVIDLLTMLTHRSIELLGAAEAGILLADGDGHLRVMAASSEQVELLELFQLQNDEGPCRDCYREGRPIIATNLDLANPWPRFSSESIRAGFPSLCALPLRHKDLVLGSLNLFMAQPVGLSDADLALAQALADVACIAIVQDAATRQAALREGQLQYALDSRVAIEQAKGMIAQHAGIDMDEAFARLRAFARNTNRGLTEVAVALIGGSRDIDAVIASRRPPPRRSSRAST